MHPNPHALEPDRQTVEAMGRAIMSRIAGYLDAAPHAPASRFPDYGHLGPELTREFRGLRLWLPLHLHGVAAFRAELDEKLDLAELAYRELAGDPLFEVPWEPDLSVVVFRLRGEDDDASRALLDTVNATGQIFLSSTQVEGRFFLRMNPTSHRTHAPDVRHALALIRESAVGAGA